MTQHVGALLLAAGFSKRFGGTKLFAELESGQQVVAQTYQRIRAAVEQVIIVTRPELEAEITALTAAPVVFAESDRGMGATLAFGVNEITKLGWDACLVCLADMPFIQTETYADIAANTASNQITIPTYQGKYGNPVAFGCEFFSDLSALTGDAGGRPVIRRHQSAVLEVPLDDSAILADIDTPQDLAALQQSLT